MTVTQQAKLSERDRLILAEVVQYIDKHEATMAEYRAVVAAVVARSSYREVARESGLAVSTLQRWVRESKA